MQWHADYRPTGTEPRRVCRARQCHQPQLLEAEHPYQATATGARQTASLFDDKLSPVEKKLFALIKPDESIHVLPGKNFVHVF